jgi:hypothetical protein
MRNSSGTALAEELAPTELRPENAFRGHSDVFADSRFADSAGDALLNREEWQLARRIASSRGFSRSELLKRFLLEVCEQALLGRAQEITEQRLGTRIFARPDGYDAGEDNIVRSYARLLRKRLDAYFAEEGAGERLRLRIPRGGYAPVFETVPGAEKSTIPQPPSLLSARELTVPELALSEPAVREDDAPPSPQPNEKPQASEKQVRLHRRWTALGLLAGAALALLAWVGAHTVEAHRRASAAHPLWAQIFAKDRNVLIVPADSGLGILENLTHTQASLDAYADGTYLASMQAPAGLDAGNFNDLSRQRYTSVVDLGICAALERLPEFTADRTQIRYARGMAAEELHNSNVILLGSAHTNPWVALFDQRLNFRLAYTFEVDRSFVINQHPLGSERAIYRNGTADEHQPTYGTVAYLPDAGGTGRVLIVQGLNMAATQAAADILFSASAMAPVLRQATARDGQLRPFELLVETTSIGASAPEARVIATRVYPQI